MDLPNLSPMALSGARVRCRPMSNRAALSGGQDTPAVTKQTPAVARPDGFSFGKENTPEGFIVAATPSAPLAKLASVQSKAELCPSRSSVLTDSP